MRRRELVEELEQRHVLPGRLEGREFRALPRRWIDQDPPEALGLRVRDHHGETAPVRGPEEGHHRSVEQATLLGCGVFTGFGAATNSVDVSVGDAVAVFGAGGVGLCAVQGARLRQAGKVVAVDLVAEKLELAERLGATATVDASTADPVAEIRALTGGVDYAIEAVGSPAVVEQAVDVLRPTGTAVLVGTPPSGKHRLDVDVHDLILGERSIVGSFNGSYDLQTAIPRLAELVESGALDVEPLITDRRRLDELPRAMDALEAGTQLRQVLVP